MYTNHHTQYAIVLTVVALVLDLAAIARILS